MIRLLSLLVFIGLFTACGFHPRGGLSESIKDKTIALTGIGPSVNLYNLFVQRLKTAGGKFTNTSAEASVIVRILKQRHIRRPITLSAVGRANMFDLNYIVVFEVQDNKGHILSKASELAIRREYFNTQASPLGQGLEEQQYRTEMESEASLTLLRQVTRIIENPVNISSDTSARDSAPNGPEALINGSMQP
jgi:LPS-assembly lipoprotein